MIDLSKLITAEQKEAKKAREIKENRVAELKQLLADTDYKVLPDYDNTNDDIKVQRQAWRDEIRAVMLELAENG